MEVPVKENALIAVEKLDITVVFSEDGMAKLLKEVETKAIAHVPDTTTEHGRKDIASLAYKITRSKTLIDDLGKDVVSDWKKKAKKIDGHRKTARDFLDNLKDRVRQPLADWEAKEVIIKADKEAAEKVLIQGRVDALLAVDLVMPFFDIAMLSGDEYTVLLSKATEEHQAKQNRLIKESMAREAETKRLAEEKAAQEAEATRLAEIQAAQETKERELKEQQEAIENEKKKTQEAIEKAKREEKERIDRAAFEKQAREDARIQAEKDAEKEKIEQIAKVEETRLRSLQAVGFVYLAKDLGIMQDKKFFALLDKHKKAWNKKQKAILAEKIEQDRLKAEKIAAAERARVEALRPERERLNLYAQSILDIPLPEVKDERLQAICLNAKSRLVEISDRIIEQVEEL